jgi:hypothetical protein
MDITVAIPAEFDIFAEFDDRELSSYTPIFKPIQCTVRIPI